MYTNIGRLLRPTGHAWREQVGQPDHHELSSVEDDWTCGSLDLTHQIPLSLLEKETLKLLVGLCTGPPLLEPTPGRHQAGSPYRAPFAVLTGPDSGVPPFCAAKPVRRLEFYEDFSHIYILTILTIYSYHRLNTSTVVELKKIPWLNMVSGIFDLRTKTEQGDN